MIVIWVITSGELERSNRAINEVQIIYKRENKIKNAYNLHTLVHHARREILLTHPFMILGQIQVALVVETKLALRKRIERQKQQ